MAAELHSAVTARLRAIGQRYTAQRRALVLLLAATGQPLTIPEICARDDDIPKSSVYRNLTVLEEADVVERVVTDAEFARYELSQSLTSHHHHLVCGDCGTVEDFTVSAELERRIQEVAAETHRRSGFHITSHRFELVGRCARCSEA